MLSAEPQVVEVPKAAGKPEAVLLTLDGRSLVMFDLETTGLGENTLVLLLLLLLVLLLFVFVIAVLLVLLLF